MKRKTWLIPVAAGLLGISLTACGLFGSSSQTSSSSSSPASSGSSSSSSSAGQSAGQSSSQPVSSAPESTSSSQSASQPESSSAPASSAAQTVDWNGSYVMAEGSASQRSLTISDSSATGFTFSFYSRGIEYTGTASVSGVNATYQDGYFYIITYDRSPKMEQIRKNPQVAISGDWFTCHGLAESLGWFRKEENREIAAKLWEAFSSWIENGHNDFDDENTIILRVKVTDRVLYFQGRRFEQ